ncbi:hypothetical protein [Neotabrizicola shimadae]|uniref:Uncharacterized protein n=1 Tax=Neotabrizicola shimadae TaxID=2807096 RepID=A0A8G1ECD3_9RHOB|nr:hypothetical protein [Neotabrizicola shimadae]QYZ68264.1 hypothetical protein JO391_10710 [Neotabrizicola shimadae]
MKMDPSWSSLPHKSYPQVLSGQICRRLKTEKVRAQRTGDVHLLKTIDAALRAIPEICTIIKEANATRVIADYEPTVLVRFDSNARFSLNEIDVSRAHGWQSRIQTLVGAVLTAWRQIDV